jgi:carbonic anhydrase
MPRKSDWRSFASTGWANLSHIVLHIPSEHTIDGKRFALEVQFFHTDNIGRRVVVSQLYAVRAIHTVFKIMATCLAMRMMSSVYVMAYGDFRRDMPTTRFKR